MDLQTGLMVGGVAMAVCAVLVLVSLFRTSGTSYEEAVAEQRRATSELLALANPTNKQALKKNKKAGKKAKEKKQKEIVTGDSDAPADSGLEEEAPAPQESPPSPARPHVEFVESTVVDVPLNKPPKPQIRKRGKDVKIKPILTNKDEAIDPPGQLTPPVLYNNFEELHPKDECELLHSHLADRVEKKEEVIEKKETKPVKAAKSKQVKQPAPTPVPAPEPVVEEIHQESLSIGDSAKEQRKTKKNEKRQVVDDAGDKVVQEEPSPSPVPSDADKVKPPPQATKSKKKKTEQNVLSIVGSDGGAVSVSELVRLVSDAVLSRTEIQILTDALLNKQHGVLPQHGEWSEGPNDPVQKLKKQLAEKEKALADEQEASLAIHNKLKELRASLNTERSRANAAVRVAEETASSSKVEIHTLQVRMQRVLEESHALAQDKLVLQSKLQVESEAAAQRVQLEMHIQRLTETEAALVSQLGALQAELGARALEAGQARCEVVQLQQHAAELAQQLQEANRVCAEIEGSRASLAHAEQTMAAELRATTERLAEQQAEAQRAAHGQAQADRALEESDRRCRQLVSEMKSLREQLMAKEEEIKIQHSKHQQNGLPPQDDTQKKADLKKLEVMVETLNAELQAALASHARDKLQLSELSAQLQQYREKNNELRTKNWKVMEALQSAEKLLQSRSAPHNDAHEAVTKALEQQTRETVELLRAACPQAAPSGPCDAAWLTDFARQLSAVVLAAGVRDDDSDGLRSQNAKLQELVDKYKKIIEDTEGVLSELQKNVTAEEGRWARMLQEKQRELDRLQQTTVTQMQKKIDALQAELDHRSAPKSLAEVERVLEETNRLLTISEKDPQIESLNGPSQVGLEEK